ncbi:MAG TPA: hypothetical protein PKE31_21385 [Pseudomonadota bacterium]|nr:hypothetical protein [Pseudomonadota bacterium]
MRDILGHIGAWAPRPEQVATAEFLGDTAAYEAFQLHMTHEVKLRLEHLHAGLSELAREAMGAGT